MDSSEKRAGRGRHLLAMTVGLITLGTTLLPTGALAGVDSIWEAIKGSEFRFARLQTDVPFYPIGWAQDTFYPRARFEDENDVLPDSQVVENTFNLGLLAPAYVARRDMLILGADCAWDDLHVHSGPYQDQSVLRFAPVTAWLHQFGESEMVSAFAAPTFSRELLSDQPWGCSVYAGVIGMHWFSDTFQLLYGGVYQYSFGQQQGYPYFGVMWSPSPKCSVTLTFPWPAITYAPRDRWLLQLGVAPGGSSWVRRGNDFETTESLSSWNLTAGVGYRFYGNLWLYASGGVAGLRGLEIDTGTSSTRFQSQPTPVFSLAIQFRP